MRCSLSGRGPRHALSQLGPWASACAVASRAVGLGMRCRISGRGPRHVLSQLGPWASACTVASRACYTPCEIPMSKLSDHAILWPGIRPFFRIINIRSRAVQRSWAALAKGRRRRLRPLCPHQPKPRPSRQRPRRPDDTLVTWRALLRPPKRRKSSNPRSR